MFGTRSTRRTRTLGLPVIVAIGLVAAALVLPSPAAASVTYSLIKSVNVNDGRCLQASPAGDELPVVGATCDPSSIYQLWEFPYVRTVGATPYYRIRNPYTQKCLLMRSFGSSAYKAVQYPCLNFDDQAWRLPFAGQPGTLVNLAHGHCMVLRSWQTQAVGDVCAGYPDRVKMIDVVLPSA